jgi:DNA helicase INO80
MIRKFFNNKKFSGTVDSPFHVVITSYQLIVSDEKSFHRLKWAYIVLD